MAVNQAAKSAHQVPGHKPKPAEDSVPVLHVKVYSPFKSYFDEKAFSLSCVNATGPFDILPHHHNFISLLLPCEVIVRTANGEVKVRIGGGILHVKSDQVTLFLDV